MDGRNYVVYSTEVLKKMSQKFVESKFWKFTIISKDSSAGAKKNSLINTRTTPESQLMEKHFFSKFLTTSQDDVKYLQIS